MKRFFTVTLLSVMVIGLLIVGSLLPVWKVAAENLAAFNGAIYETLRTASLANYPAAVTLTAVNSTGAAIQERGARWSVVSSPAVSNQATASIAAEANVRHVADCVAFSSDTTAAPAATHLSVVLRDGATGAGTIIWRLGYTIPATAASHAEENFCGLNLVGSTNTAMTLEWSAGLTNEFQTATITGFNVQ